MHSPYEGAKHAMAGKEHPKSKKEVREIRTRKAKSGGYIHEHHHTHPEDHPMEEHMSADQEAMAGHMLDHMGDANAGDANQDAAAAPAPAVAAAQPAVPAMAV